MYKCSNKLCLQALSGFLMMMTQHGKLLYISDNAAEYLGHSMVSDSFFFLVFPVIKFRNISRLELKYSLASVQRKTKLKNMSCGL